MKILPIQFQCALCGMEIEDGIGQIGIVPDDGSIICAVTCSWCGDERYYTFKPANVLMEHLKEVGYGHSADMPQMPQSP